MKHRRTYPHTRVDFTPFVSIALLLIVFFVWTKTVQRQNTLIVKHITGCRKGIEPERSRYELSIILSGPDTLQFCYHPAGRIKTTHSLTTICTTRSLYTTLLHYKRAALIPGELAIVIYPLRQSTVGNLVRLLSQLRRVGNLPYLIEVHYSKPIPSPYPARA
jgi:hypothetical protein